MNSNHDYFYAQYDMGVGRFEDFEQTGSDLIFISKLDMGFDADGTGVQGASRLEVGTSHLATAASTRLIFETDTRTLWADLDGTGTEHGSILLAVIDDAATLVAGDFWVVA